MVQLSVSIAPVVLSRQGVAVIIHSYRRKSRPGQETVVALGSLESAGQLETVDLQ